MVAASGQMTTARCFHTAALLNSGKVLLAGGDSSCYEVAALDSAELFDPTDGLFTPTGSMLTAREQFTANLLASGKVLVVGGQTYSGSAFSVVDSAELYDPGTGSFAFTGSMASPRVYFTATSLPNGKVLVVGGVNSLNWQTWTVLATAEVYDPASGTFSPTGNLITPRYSHSASLLANGKVLIAGGYDSNLKILASAEIYDPATGSFSATGNMNVPRADGVPVANNSLLLGTGKVLVFEGIATCSTAELYDPSLGTFSFSTTPPEYCQAFASGVLLSNGLAFIPGGDIESGSYGQITNKTRLFDPQTGTFYAGPLMTYTHWFGTTTLLANGSVLIAGGWDDGNTADIYTPDPSNPITALAQASQHKANTQTNVQGKGTERGRTLPLQVHPPPVQAQ
jgi:hypothetical protein